MIDIDFQLSASLGRTTVDAAAAGWMLFDYITNIDTKINCTFQGNRIAFGGPRPFCVLEAHSSYIDCRLTPPAAEGSHPSAQHRHFRLASMADMTPALERQITRAAAQTK